MSELPPLNDEETPSPVTNNTKYDWIYDNVIGSVTDADATPPPSSRIPKVPGTLTDKHDYNKYFAPKLVSIGPYHFMTAETKRFQKRKRVFAMKVLNNDKETLGRLFEKLGEPEMVADLRSCYEQDHLQLAGGHEDFEFTTIMLLDSCFILYFIKFFVSGTTGDEFSELTSSEILLVFRDLYLLENQIPFKVVMEAIDLINEPLFITAVLVFTQSLYIGTNGIIEFESGKLHTSQDLQRNMDGVQHLLGAFHRHHSRTKESTWPSDPLGRFNFRKVSELVDVGIHFKPNKFTRTFDSVEFVKGRWRFSATVKLPRIVVTDVTKYILLNLIAYEMCNCSDNNSWVTSYVCLLDSLIDDAEDVKILRKSWVLEHSLSSDKEVADLFNEIAKDLAMSNSKFAYFEAKQKMQEHYRSTRNTLFSQLRNEYFKNPWAIFAVTGALIVVFLTIVQTYYTVWSPKSTCDDLCMFLKINHHL